MAGFDVNSLSSELLREILQDKQEELSALTMWQSFGDVRDVTEQEGSVYIWDEPMSMSDAGHRTSEVAPDADTPIGNASLGTVQYTCPEYRFAMSLNRMAEKSLSSLDDAIDKLVMRSAYKVLGDFNSQIASVFLGNGAAATSDDLTQKAAANAWDTALGTPLDDIDDVVDELGSGLDCYIGGNVATVLSKNSDVTGSAAGSGREFVEKFDGVRQFLQNRGIGNIYFLGAQEQANEPNQTRSYDYIYQDVFVLSIPGNIVIPRYIPLEQSVHLDDLNGRKYFRANHSHDIVRGYAEHTYYYSGIIT